MDDLAIQTKQLNRVYQVRSPRGERRKANVEALEGVDMEVKRGELLTILAGMTLLYGAVAVLFFHCAENRARQRGLLDAQTQF